MKQIEKVWAAINAHKENLSTHKVELNLVGDVQKALSDGKSALSKAQKAFDQLDTVDRELVNQVKKAIADADKASAQYTSARDEAIQISIRVADILERAEQGARELGFDAKSIQGYSELDNIFNDLDSLPIDYDYTDLRTIVS